MKTIHELMVQFRGNQSRAAIALNINRNTLKKYLADKTGERHIVREVNGEPRLFAALGSTE